jgi:hypothetical protein
MKKLKLTDKILLATLAALFGYITVWLIWVNMHWDEFVPLMYN